MLLNCGLLERENIRLSFKLLYSIDAVGDFLESVSLDGRNSDNNQITLYNLFSKECTLKITPSHMLSCCFVCMQRIQWKK